MSQPLGFAFIAGAPRTGSTLLQTLLDGVPGVASGPEFDIVPDLVRLRGALRARVMAGRHRIYFDTATIDRASTEYLRTLFASYAEKRQAHLVVDKTPWNVLEAASILEFLPDSKMVLCVRDPRATVNSLLAVGRRARDLQQSTPWMTHDLAAAIFTVKKCTDAVIAARDAYPDRTLVVRFEDLATDTRRITERVCAFLGVPFCETALSPEQRPHDASAAADGAWYSAAAMGRAPDSTRAAAWRTELSPGAIRRITAAFVHDPSFEALGYRMLPGPSWSVAWQLALGRTRLERLAERTTLELTARGRRIHVLRELSRRARLGGWG